MLFANIKNSSVTYDVSYGFIGKLAEAKASVITEKDNSYTIKVKAYATGFSKFLSNNLKEEYKSIGKIVNSKFQPNIFTKISQTNDKYDKYTYIFNHKEKSILLEHIKKRKIYEDSTQEDDFYYNDNFSWEIGVSIKKLNFYNNEDILSLFFNIKYYMKDFKEGNTEHIVAIGSSTSRKGIVDLIVPSGKKVAELKELLGTSKNILIVKVYTNIFSSDSGELYISLNQDGICNKAVLKDVLFFGDVIGKLR